jgi:hypothetical protein
MTNDDRIKVIASNNSSGTSWSFDEELVFSADVLMPVQFYPAASATPYQRLLAAVLGDAIYCFQKHCGAESRRHRVLFREAEAWLFDAKDTSFMSCPTVCESLGIDPAELRRCFHEWQLVVKAGRDVPRPERRSPIPTEPHISSPDLFSTGTDRIAQRRAATRTLGR